MKDGICQLCLESRQLCNSHALPDSIVKYVLRKNSGKFVAIADDQDTQVKYSSDTWDVEMLCADCEKKLNEKYDAYGIAVFRGHGQILRETDGVRFIQIDRRRLRMFFLSVLWRASVSTHPNYFNVSSISYWKEDLRSALHFNNPMPQCRYTVFVRKMRDSTPQNGFDSDAIREIICSPMIRQYKSFISVCFPFLGFFVEIFIPKITGQFSKIEGVLQGGNKDFLAPYVELLEIPEIFQLFVRGLHKQIAGISQID